MTEPGWYADHHQPGQLRYHDGTQWTEHVHPAPPAEAIESSTPVGSAAVATGPSESTEGTSAGSTRSNLLGLAAIGAFVGLILGGFLFNGIGSITPVAEYMGTVERIEVEFSSGSGSTNRRSYVLSGSTDGGPDWRMVNEDAYRVLEAEGYPQEVVVAIGTWSDAAERITGATWEVDHQTTGARIAWGAVLGVIALATLAGAVGIARSSGGVVGAVVFLIACLGPGVWLGFHAFQWVQSA